MLESVVILIIIVSLISALAAFELLYRSRPKAGIQPLTYERTGWEITEDTPEKRVYGCFMGFKNFNRFYEGTVAELSVKADVLFKNEKKTNLSCTVKIAPEEATRNDGYIISFLVKPDKTVKTKLTLEFTGDITAIEEVHAVVVRVNYSLYDRTGYHPGKFSDIIFVPVRNAVQADFKALEEKEALIYPVKTHLLTDQDDMADIINKYARPILKEGDIVVIAESPVAITQRRFVHPNDIQISPLARRLCYFVGSAGSLSSPCGMQCAINELGVQRVLLAFFIGGFMKAIGKPGWFYTIAGVESELIDDLTGTIPPYDKYIVLGPENPDQYVEDLKKKTGVDIAIADANDLKRAKIVASTLKDAEDKIKTWLKNNPAGNAYEQTPIVIIRPNNLDLNKRNEYAQTSKV